MKLYRTPRFFRILFPNKTWGFSLKSKSVFLTFDDGPDAQLTPWVLDYLKQENIQATFFCVGENVKKNPEIFARILEEGHSVGNHSMRHEKGSVSTFESYISSIEEAADYIPTDLFRPPYGRITQRQTNYLKKKFRIVMWTWLSYDYDRKVSTDNIIEKAKGIRGGDIIVLHDNPKTGDRLKVLLPEIVRIIQQKGLNLNSIENKLNSKISKS